MKLVLTGGPSGGKTTLANLIQKEFSDRVLIVPEAASILYAGGFPRRPNPVSLKRRQKAIYYVQRELEGIVSDEHPDKLLICDRGSLDGVAYWPGHGGDYLSSVGTTLDAEIGRYDWILHLDTAPEPHYDISNPLRTESFREAWTLNERVKSAWERHPRRFVIGNGSGHFVGKLTRALAVVQDILRGKTFAQIADHLAKMGDASKALLKDEDDPSRPTE